MKFIFDAHLDLAMNALEWNRDLTQTVSAINKREAHLTDKPDRGKATVSLPALRAGRIGLCMATQIARYVAPNNPLPGWHSQAQAWAQSQGQSAWYKAMEYAGEMVQISSKQQLETHLALWETTAEKKPIGYILSLEGADSILSMAHLNEAYKQGLRAIGPAHYGPGVYAYGTDSVGGLGIKGRTLLKAIEALGMILDMTHLCDESFWETLAHYQGHLWASHSNARALVPNHRQFSDEQIKVLVERGAVIGVALDAWMMIPNWQRGLTDPKAVNLTLDTLVNHIDHICQLCGNADHVGIGSDLDGAFGKEQCPHDLETITDLQKLDLLLAQRGYSEEAIQNILSQNFIRFLRNALPDAEH